jgi:Mannosyltransferase (PIG-M)
MLRHFQQGLYIPGKPARPPRRAQQTLKNDSLMKYFMWYLWFLPLILPRLRISFQRAGVLVGVWVGVQVSTATIWMKLKSLSH